MQRTDYYYANRILNKARLRESGINSNGMQASPNPSQAKKLSICGDNCRRAHAVSFCV